MKIGKTTIGDDPKLIEIKKFCKGMPKMIKNGLSLDEVVKLIEKKLKEIESDGSVKNYDNEFIIIEFPNKLNVVVLAGDIDGLLFAKIEKVIDGLSKKSEWFCARISEMIF